MLSLAMEYCTCGKFMCRSRGLHFTAGELPIIASRASQPCIDEEQVIRKTRSFICSAFTSSRLQRTSVDLSPVVNLVSLLVRPSHPLKRQAPANASPFQFPNINIQSECMPYLLHAQRRVMARPFPMQPISMPVFQ